MPGVDRPRTKVLALNAYLSLSRLSPDLLQDGTFVQSVISRLEDGEESVTRAALETCLQLVSVRTSLLLLLLLPQNLLTSVAG